MKKKLTIATRGSQLALIQSNMIKDWIISKNPDIEVELNIIKTTGDKILDSPLSKVGGKGLFVKEIEESLLSKESDLAVHSMKDVPTELPEGLHIIAVGKRESPNDVLISNKYKSLSELPANAKIGTSSLRRQVQLLNHYPDFQILDIRGNVNTRLSKLESENMDAIILAAAGIKRMGFSDRITELIDINISIPAVGQGAIGIETRIDDTELNEFLSDFNDSETFQCLETERGLMRHLEGGCQVPIGGHAYFNADKTQFSFKAMVATLDGKTLLREESQWDCQTSSINFKEKGIEIAEKLKSQGADKILSDIRH